MHRISSFIVAVGLLLAPSVVGAQVGAQEEDARKEQSLQLKKRQPAVGDVDTVDMQVLMRMDFELSGPELEPEPLKMSSTTANRFTTTVLAARKGIVDRVKVAYGDAFDETVEDGKTEREVSPVSGKTYLAGMTKGRLVVTDEAGKPVSKEEQAAAEEYLPELGKADPLEAALPDKPIRVGDSLDRFAQVLTKEVLQNGGSSTRCRGTRVRLSEITQDAQGLVGIFSVSTMMTIKQAGSPIVLTIPLEGRLSVLAEGARVLEFSLAGPVQVAMTEAMRKEGVTVKGEGEMKLRMTSSVPR
jgi:hypothetical protein